MSRIPVSEVNKMTKDKSGRIIGGYVIKIETTATNGRKTIGYAGRDFTAMGDDNFRPYKSKHGAELGAQAWEERFLKYPDGFCRKIIGIEEATPELHDFIEKQWKNTLEEISQGIEDDLELT